MNFLLHLRQEWDVIAKTPFACVICVVIGFAVGSWYYAEQVATLNNQVNFWKDKATALPTATATATVTGVPASSPPASTSSGSAKAHFTLNMTGGCFFVSPSDHSLTVIVLDANIRNSGASSVATDWKLSVAPKGRNPVPAEYQAIPDVMNAPCDPPLTLRAKDNLADKVVGKRVLPIPSFNAKVESGKLLFYIRLPKNVVADDATQMTLSVQDIAGNVFETKATVGSWLRPRGSN